MRIAFASATTISLVLTIIAAIVEQQGCSVPDLIPGPKPPPSPVASDSLRVLFVEESSERSKLPLGQLAVLNSTPLRRWLQANTEDWRMVDANDAPQDLSPTMQEMFARQRATVPWMIVCGPNGGAEGPLPDSPDAAIKAIEQFVGVKP